MSWVLVCNDFTADAVNIIYLELMMKNFKLILGIAILSIAVLTPMVSAGSGSNSDRDVVTRKLTTFDGDDCKGSPLDCFSDPKY